MRALLSIMTWTLECNTFAWETSFLHRALSVSWETKAIQTGTTHRLLSSSCLWLAYV